MKNSHEIYEEVGGEKTLVRMFAETEFCEKGELFQLVFKNCGLPEEIAIYLFKEILDGVSFLHHQGIYHRDLKLENIFLSDDWKPKIGDFGFATKKRQASKVMGS